MFFKERKRKYSAKVLLDPINYLQHYFDKVRKRFDMDLFNTPALKTFKILRYRFTFTFLYL